ncbi:membrane hypothetical protein [Desulfovibrionales bacterium]
MTVGRHSQNRPYPTIIMLSPPDAQHRQQRTLMLRYCGHSAILAALASLMAVLLLPVHPAFLAPLDPNRTATLAIPMDAEAEGWIYSLPLRFMLPIHLGHLDRLEIEVTTTGSPGTNQRTATSSLPVAEATLEFDTSDCSNCRLTAPARQSLNQEDTLVLVSFGTGCPDLWQQAATTGGLDAVLRIRLAAYGSVSLVISKPSVQSGLLTVLDSAPGYCNVQGRLAWRPNQPTAVRLDLLAWLWDLSPSGSWIIIILLGCAGLAACGIELIIAGNSLPIATGCLALALASAYAVILPPLHAPDEPAHFLSFTSLADRNDLFFKTFRLARRDHLDRLHSNTRELFLPADRNTLDVTPWNNTVTMSEMTKRSWLTTQLWKGAIPFLSHIVPDTPAGWLLGLRLLHGLGFSLATGLGTWLLAHLAGSSQFTWPLFIFAVPTLPFFAMHVSNYALSTMVLLLLGCANLGFFLRRGDFPASGLLIGGLTVLLVLTGSTGTTLLAWLAAIIAARIFLNLDKIWNMQEQIAGALRFWGGLLATTAFLYPLRDTPQVTRLLDQIVQIIALFLPLALSETLAHPIAWTLSTPLALLGELALGRLTASPAMTLMLKGIRRTALLGLPIALGLVLSFLALSANLPFTDSPNEIQTIPLNRYLREVTFALVTGCSFREPDILLSETFWIGFGWHHMGLPKALARWLAGGTGIGLILVLWRVWRIQDDRRTVWLGFWAIGTLGVGLTAALAAYKLGFPNVHGRYLIGFYAILLSVAGAGFAAWPGETFPLTTLSLRLGSAIVICIALHATCLAKICIRIFG